MIKIMYIICYAFRLLLGFMLTTFALSMWMSNTVVTSMMIPIVQGVLNAIQQQYKSNIAENLCVQVILMFRDPKKGFVPTIRKKKNPQ